MKKLVSSLLLVFSSLILGYKIFIEVFFDKVETDFLSSSSFEQRFENEIDDQAVFKQCLELGVTVTFNKGQYLISNGKDEFYWTFSPVISFADTTYIVFATGNWGETDNLLEVIFLPTYSDLVVIRYDDLKILHSVRIPGVFKNALILDGYVYFSREWGESSGRFKI